MSFRAEIEAAANSKVNSGEWIHFFNGLLIVVSLIGFPFTMGASLFCLLAVPFNSALANIATNSSRQTQLTKLHLMLLADKYDLN